MRSETTYRGPVEQLRLLPGAAAEPDWRVDQRTREIGRQGVAQAREILRRIAAARSESDRVTHAGASPSKGGR
jgi:hypothetical protein